MRFVVVVHGVGCTGRSALVQLVDLAMARNIIIESALFSLKNSPGCVGVGMGGCECGCGWWWSPHKIICMYPAFDHFFEE